MRKFEIEVALSNYKHLRQVYLSSKELELYKEELLTKPVLLVINKMDLPCSKNNLDELTKQLQNPQGKLTFNNYLQQK